MVAIHLLSILRGPPFHSLASNAPNSLLIKPLAREKCDLHPNQFRQLAFQRISEIGESRRELVNTGLGVARLSSLKLTNNELQFQVRIGSQIGKPGEVIFDFERLVGLPAVLLVAKQQLQLLLNPSIGMLLKKRKHVGW